MSLTLQQIAENFAALEALLEDSGGEVTPEVDAWLAEYSLAEREKVDAYIGYIKSLESDATAQKALADELSAKAQAKLNRVKWLKGRMAEYMSASGFTELPGTIWKFAFQKNGGKPPLALDVDDVAAWPPQFHVTTTAIDTQKVRAVCEEQAEAGDAVIVVDGALVNEDGTVLAHLAERGQSLRIR